MSGSEERSWPEVDRRRKTDRRSGTDRRDEAGWIPVPLDASPEADASLIDAAASARLHARADYSGFKVGAALELADGTIVTGCNVENASYGLTLCAECGLVSGVHATGGGRLVAVAITDSDGRDLAPCGRCRQLLWEAGGAALVVNERPMAEWLPFAWDATELH